MFIKVLSEAIGELMYKKYFKRTTDLILCVVLFPFFLLITLIVGPIIYAQDKGPIFYNSNRLGKDGKVFVMYKFRTMKINAPDFRNSDGSTMNSENDVRLTPIGGLLRKTSLDEVPQILNVLKGEMSIIGPRPDLPEHIELYTGNEHRKLEVKAGITGYSQAYYRNSVPWKTRIQHDIYYVDNMNFILDLRIFMRTIKSVLFKENIYASKSEK